MDDSDRECQRQERRESAAEYMLGRVVIAQMPHDSLGTIQDVDTRSKALAEKRN
jgi:hypothetical protein